MSDMMHKTIMKVTTKNEELQFDPSDNEDVLPETHNKLLNAVTQIYRKQWIDKPKRREPTLQISEFNLSNKTTDNDGKLIDVHDLVNVLNAKATHHEIKKKVKTMQQKSKPLPKPMEKLYADKLRRQQGYVNLRKQLNRWEAIVQRNRAAPQLKFPLERFEKVKESHDFMKTFKEPTELEKQIAAVLQTSDTAQEERQKEEELFPLSLEEIIERRKMIAHMRARESYRIAKAIRQNKIKSKKYHRILKRERIKKELKDFEILQKTNPEAALEKLEKIERARAEERISLRHRNTGKWARSRAIRAKYDTEARAQLAEQLAKSRDLTRKVQAGIDSTSEEESDDNEAGKEILQTDPTNPWNPETEKAETEIESFVAGFKNYQEVKKKEKLQDHTLRPAENKFPPGDTSKVESNNIHLGHVAVKETSEILVNMECDEAPNEESNVNMQNGVENGNSDNEEEDSQKGHADDPGEVDINAMNQNSSLTCDNFETDNVDSIRGSSDGDGGDDFNNSDEDNNVETVTHLVTKIAKQTAPIVVEEKQISTQSNILKNKTCLQEQNKAEHLSKILKSSPSRKARRDNEKEVLSDTTIPSLTRKKMISVSRTEENNINGDFEINLQDKKSLSISKDYDSKEAKDNESEKEIWLMNKKNKIKVKKQLNLVNQSGTWEVSAIDTKSNEHTKEMYNGEDLSENKIDTIDKIFYNAEHKLKNTLANHINKLKSNLSNVDCKPEKLKKSKYHADLSLKSSVKRPHIDTTLIEVANEGISTGENDIKSLVDIYDSNKNSTKSEEISNIDPQKFLPVKPQKLNSGQLNVVEDYDESEDEEIVDKHRKLNLEEAFADDDVVEEFRREKAEDIEKSKPKDIDLNLPGWGHWAGYSMAPKAEKRRKRKNRRLIIKFPKIPRRDDKKDYVIINEEASNDFKKHMVHDLPFPFKSVKDYETSIRAPIGNTWVPQSAFMKLIQPSVVTKLGNIIEPMSESELPNFKKRKVQKK